MFTLKLQQLSPRIQNRESKSRIVSADSFTLYWYGDHACQVTAHQKDSGEDRCFWVGNRAAVDHSLPENEIMYDRAFIENAVGKTTEVICPEPMTGSGEQRAA